MTNIYFFFRFYRHIVITQPYVIKQTKCQKAHITRRFYLVVSPSRAAAALPGVWVTGHPTSVPIPMAKEETLIF